MPSTLEKITTALNEIKHLNAGAIVEAKLRQDDHDKLILLESWVKKDLVRRVKDLETREDKRAKAKADAVTRSGLRTWQVWLLLIGMIPGTIALIITILKWFSESPIPSP